MRRTIHQRGKALSDAEVRAMKDSQRQIELKKKVQRLMDLRRKKSDKTETRSGR